MAANPCKLGARPEYYTVGTRIYVKCVDDAKRETLATALAIGLSVGLLTLFILAFLCFCCYREFRIKSAHRQTIEIASPRNKWESFIHEGSYVRRIAQVLEAEENMPVEVFDHIRENDPETFEKIEARSPFDFVERAGFAIAFLLKKQAALENTTVVECMYKWRGTLIETYGGEWAERIMDATSAILDQSSTIALAIS